MKTYLSYLAVSTVAVLAPIKGVMITVGILIFADLVTGIWAALKRKEAISSAAMRRTISKMVVYQIAVVTGFLVQKFLLQDTIPVVNLIGGVIGMTELRSVIENGGDITGKDLFTEILKRLGSKNDQRGE